MNAPRTILITGGGGMLAQALRTAAASAFADASLITPARNELDVTNPNELGAFFKQCHPDLVFNCAAYTKVDLAETERSAAEACNAVAVGHLAQLCREFDAQLVHFSTDYVFDGSVSRPLRPDDPVGPQSAYGRSKLSGEQLIQRDPPARWLIVRTAWLYGFGGPNFVQTMVTAARAGKPLKVVNDQVGSPTYTADLAEAAIDLIKAGAEGIWHVTNAGQTSWFDFAAAIFKEFGLAPSLSSTTSNEWKSTRPGSAVRPKYSVLDVEPIAHLRGRPMRHWHEALRAFKNEAEARGGL